MKIDQLQKFLFRATLAGYASGTEGRKEQDGSTTIVFEKEDFKMDDNFFGGEPYGGREIVFYQGKPVWIMVYYGAVNKSVNDIKNVYKFLQKALREVPGDLPVRGPREFNEKESRYENIWQGGIEQFSGEEKIFKGNQEIYSAKYVGGLVNQRKE